MRLVAQILQQKRCNKVKNEKYLSRNKKIYDASNIAFIDTGTNYYLFDLWCDECWVNNG
jgi:hypothetical protein